MIKNAIQAKRLVEKLQDILNKIQQLESQYSGDELVFREERYRDQLVKVQKELNEYNLLTTLPMENAIRGP